MIRREQSDEDEKVLAERVKVTQIVYAAMAASVIIYAAIGYLVAVSSHPFVGFADMPKEVKIILRGALWAIAIIGFFPITILLRYTMLRPQSIAPTVKTIGDFASLFVRQSIVVAALAETPAIMGLALFLLAGSWFDLTGLCALAMSYLAFTFPTTNKAVQLAKCVAAAHEHGEYQDRHGSP